MRFSRMRKRRTWRARGRLVLDKSLGWVIVTIVGFLTAIVAFLVVRGEAWLFDLKEGYCTVKWWQSRKFCCPEINDLDEGCADWRTWSLRKEGLVEYVSYSCIAVSLSFFIFPSPTVRLARSCYIVMSLDSLPHQLHYIRYSQGVGCSCTGLYRRFQTSRSNRAAD